MLPVTAEVYYMAGIYVIFAPYMQKIPTMLKVNISLNRKVYIWRKYLN